MFAVFELVNAKTLNEPLCKKKLTYMAQAFGTKEQLLGVACTDVTVAAVLVC